MAEMSEAARAAQREYKREYMRRWRAANPDKVKEQNRLFWERRAAEKARCEEHAEVTKAER